jgi:hypothetical protein
MLMGVARQKLPPKHAKPKGPSRTPKPDTSTPAAAVTAGNPVCWNGCGRPAVEYKHHEWWCLRHVPTDRVDCIHPLTSPFHDRLICTYCGEVVKHNP